MIPKVIHYCWFGGNELPQSALKCIESWKDKMPDYEIKRWDESNFDVRFNQYTSEAYDKKKYAFVSDVARLFIIYNHGGIYLDVDVEVIKSFDILLENKAFFGLGSKDMLNTGLGFGAEVKCTLIKEILEDYKGRSFLKEDGSMDLTPCPAINSKIFKKYGFQLDDKLEEIDGIKVYPSEYFNPMNCDTGKITKTSNTYSIHWYKASWESPGMKIKIKIIRFLMRILGEERYKKIRRK